MQDGCRIETATLPDGRRVVLEFERLPELSDGARLMQHRGAQRVISIKSCPLYVCKLPVEARDALQNADEPLAFVELSAWALHTPAFVAPVCLTLAAAAGTNQFIMNRMCPKCFLGPIAESE